MEEQTFIADLKRNDKDAFKLLVTLYKDKVLNTSLGILQNNEDAEDITQEVFIQVYQSITQFKGESSLSTWIYRITVTKALELIRSKKRKKRFAQVLSLFDGNKDWIANSSSHFIHPGVELENKERAAILFKAIDKLPENQKTAFVLHKTEQLSYHEIADIMKVTVASVESLMFRAKQNLQKYLSDYFEQNEK